LVVKFVNVYKLWLLISNNFPFVSAIPVGLSDLPVGSWNRIWWRG
jgi:hypothetical protein